MIGRMTRHRSCNENCLTTLLKIVPGVEELKKEQLWAKSGLLFLDAQIDWQTLKCFEGMAVAQAQGKSKFLRRKKLSPEKTHRLPHSQQAAQKLGRLKDKEKEQAMESVGNLDVLDVLGVRIQHGAERKWWDLR